MVELYLTNMWVYERTLLFWHCSWSITFPLLSPMTTFHLPCAFILCRRLNPRRISPIDWCHPPPGLIMLQVVNPIAIVEFPLFEDEEICFLQLVNWLLSFRHYSLSLLQEFLQTIVVAKKNLILSSQRKELWWCLLSTLLAVLILIAVVYVGPRRVSF